MRRWTTTTVHKVQYWITMHRKKYPNALKEYICHGSMTKSDKRYNLGIIKERTWTKDPTEYNLQAFYYQRRYVANIFKSVQRENYINEIIESRDNFKAVFKITNKLLFRNKQLPLPPTSLLKDLANEVNEFFIDKINKIMVTLKQDVLDKRHIESAPMTSVNMSSFTPTTIPEMVKLIHKTTIKSCELDPLPTRLLKANIEHTVPTITDIVNTSLTLGKVITNLKQAVLQPLLKKSNLELILKNYRPVSNSLHGM